MKEAVSVPVLLQTSTHRSKDTLMLLSLKRSGKFIHPIPVRMKNIDCLHNRTKILPKVTCLDRTCSEYTGLHFASRTTFVILFLDHSLQSFEFFFSVELYIYQHFCHIQHHWNCHNFDAWFSMFQSRLDSWCTSRGLMQFLLHLQPCVQADNFCTIKDKFWIAYVQTNLKVASPEED